MFACPSPEDDFLGATDPCAGRPMNPRSGACDPTSAADSVMAPLRTASASVGSNEQMFGAIQQIPRKGHGQ
jgi:hypothetical protein